jgi:ATP-dependent Clp protease ATP-binding subunit ClpC
MKGVLMDDTSMPRLPYLTTRAHKAFAFAHDLADRLGHDSVTPMHLGVAILRQQGLPFAALHRLNVPVDLLEHEFADHLLASGAARPATATRDWSEWDHQLIESAREEARELETEFYGTEHLLLALVRESATAPAQLLARHGVSYDSLRREIQRLYDSRPG